MKILKKIQLFCNRYRVLISIVCVAALLRLLFLGAIPVGTYIDETAIGLDAFMIAHTGKDMYGHSPLTPIFYSYGDYKLPMYIWVTVPSVAAFGRTAFAIRLPSCVAGIISVVLIYFIALEIFKKHKKKEYIAAASACTITLLPWSVLFSRTGFEGHLAQMFLLVMMLGALHVSKSKLWWLVSMLGGVCALYTYYSARFVVPVVLCVTLFLTYRETKHRWKYIKQVGITFLVSVVAFGLAFLPMLRSPLYKESQLLRLSSKNIFQQQEIYVARANMLQDQDHNDLISRVLHHRMMYLVKNLTHNISLHLDLDYLLFSGDSNLRHSTGTVGIMLSVMFPFFIAGFYVLAKKDRALLLFFFVWWMVSLVPASVPLEIPHALRSLNALGMFPIVIGLGVIECWIWLSKKSWGKTIIVVTLFFIMINVALFIHDYLMHYPTRSAKAWSDGYKKVAEVVGNSRSSVQHIYVVGGQKILIWILYYGGFSPKEISAFVQIAKDSQFDHGQFENIEVNASVWKEKLKTMHGTIIVVGDKDAIGSLGDAVEYPIEGAGGKTSYVYDVVQN